MKIKWASNLTYAGLVVVIICFAASCRLNTSTSNTTVRIPVRDSVSRIMANIATDISNHGPVAWLNYFEDTPDFYMASDGQMAFKDHQSATLFIEDTLVKNIRHIRLRWSDLRIDSLTPRLASVGANFHEDLTNATGQVVSPDGYFTGLAEKTDSGWRLRNLHWSILKAK